MTEKLLLVLVILLCLYNVFVGYKYGPEATISVTLNRLAEDNPIIVLIIGVILGHMFWPLRV